MKRKLAFEAAVRWAGRDVARAVEIVQQQCELRPEELEAAIPPERPH